MSEFYSREFFVNSQTLDPRPETELIIDLIKNFKGNFSKSIKILDLGTGTGCIIISLYLELIKKKNKCKRGCNRYQYGSS